MARCWSCGSQIPGGIRYLFTCPTCEQVQEIKSLRKEAIDNLDELVEVQRRGFETLSDRLSEVATVIEWGFEEIRWELQQQTDVLRSIDHTLKTPSETQANEWRRMAEELRRRGILDKSEELFLKALDLNPLDYRIYVGLAQTYLQMNQFDKAKTRLEESLFHAPPRPQIDQYYIKVKMGGEEHFIRVNSALYRRAQAPLGEAETDEEEDEEEAGNFLSLAEYEALKKQVIDYRSYSYRLIGHIYACAENYDQAVTVLQSALELSPNYEDAHYDYAQYCALVGKKEDCLASLQEAIVLKPLYFYLAPKERNFAPLRKKVQELLDLLERETSNKAKELVSKSEEMLRQIEEAIFGVGEVQRKSKKSLEKRGTWWELSQELDSAKGFYEIAKERFNRAKEIIKSGDYSELVEIEPKMGAFTRAANEAKKKADEVRQSCEESYRPWYRRWLE